MTMIKGHFDGNVIVIDEPVKLSVGQVVRILVEDDSNTGSMTPSRPSLFGFAKGIFVMRDDFNDPLDEFAEYR